MSPGAQSVDHVKGYCGLCIAPLRRSKVRNPTELRSANRSSPTWKSSTPPQSSDVEGRFAQQILAHNV